MRNGSRKGEAQSAAMACELGLRRVGSCRVRAPVDRRVRNAQGIARRDSIRCSYAGRNISRQFSQGYCNASWEPRWCGLVIATRCSPLIGMSVLGVRIEGPPYPRGGAKPKAATQATRQTRQASITMSRGSFEVTIFPPRFAYFLVFSRLCRGSRLTLSGFITAMRELNLTNHVATQFASARHQVPSRQ